MKEGNHELLDEFQIHRGQHLEIGPTSQEHDPCHPKTSPHELFLEDMGLERSKPQAPHFLWKGCFVVAELVGLFHEAPEWRAFGHCLLGCHAVQFDADRSHDLPGKLDAAAALLGLRHTVSFEGQAAAELEMLLEPDKTDSSAYPFEIIKAEDKAWLLTVPPIITGLVDDILEVLTVKNDNLEVTFFA